MAYKQKRIFRLIRRFNSNFPTLTTKKLKRKKSNVYKNSYKKTIFSKVYSQKLLAKQELKNIYGVSERLLKKCIKIAFIFDKKNKKGLILNLSYILERLLFIVLFKRGLAKTINQAKQMISHHKIKVNSITCFLTNYICSTGDIITIKDLNKDIRIKEKDTNMSLKNKILILKTLEFFK